MTKRTGCEARQHSDQMLCDHCGLAWDMNDPDPPECQRQMGRGSEVSGWLDRRARVNDSIARAAIGKMRKILE